ncbi:MAG: VWA domain-containing protein [Dechloromonas sp.]|nr:VWA domain-containing protein [Dechloromonas sp.]
MDDSQVKDGIGELLAEAINQDASSNNHAGADMPNRHSPVFPERPVAMMDIQASVNATRTRTLQWLSSLAECDEYPARSGVRLNPSRIWSGRFGGPIFVQEDEGTDLNAAVSILLDRSGSMDCLINQAVLASVASMLALNVPGIATQLTTFPWYDQGRDEGVAVVKSWSESPTVAARRASALSTDGGTPMAEALLFAVSDIKRRAETMKIVVVVTDGEPNNRYQTTEVIEVARQNGVHVLGLGIQCDTSPVFGTQYAAMIQDVAGLPAAMMSLVKAAFKDQRAA